MARLKLNSLSFLLIACMPYLVQDMQAADIVEEVLGANSVTAGSALGTDFLLNDASTGGSDNDATNFNRDFSDGSALYSAGDSVTLTGVAWASSATGTTATEATVTITDYGLDDTFGTADDIVVGSLTDDLVFGDAGVYVWVFDSPISYVASSDSLRINITSNGVIRRKTSTGQFNQAAVKLTVAGTATPPTSYIADSSGDWDTINWDSGSGSINGAIPDADTVIIGDDMTVSYNGVPALETIGSLTLGNNVDSQNLGQGRLTLTTGTLTISNDLNVGTTDTLNDSFLTVSGTASLQVGGDAAFGADAHSADGSLFIEGTAQVSIVGDLTMGGFDHGGSLLRVELPGSLPALTVGGAMRLDRCALDLSFASGYTHTPGTMFTLVTYGSRKGQFMNFRESDEFNCGLNRFRINYDVSGNAVVLTALANFTTSNPTPPNIIYILVDDQGYADSPLNSFSVNGHGGKDWSTVFPMPRLETLASSGIQFTNGYVTGGVCHPSRAGIITGIYQQRFGAENNLPADSVFGISPAARTVPRRLQSLGYRTYGVGKWHLGETVDNHPNVRGFDRWYGMWLGSRAYYSVIGDSQEETRVFQNDMEPDYVAENQAQNNYLTDRIGDRALAFIDDHFANHTGQPFYMYLSFTSPHGPIDIEPTDSRFTDLANDHGLELEDYAGISNGIGNSNAATTQGNRYSLAAMCLAHDENIGKVIDKLTAEGQLNNTIIVYQSDNGGTGSTNNYSINNPLTGNKGGNCQEGSFRVPTVIQWPDQFTGGQVLDTPITSLDIAAMFVNASGAPAAARNGLDGLDIADHIKNGTPLPANRVLTFRGGGPLSGGSALRMGHYKLRVVDSTQTATVYDFSDATPGVVDGQYAESVGNQANNPELEAEMLERFKAWEARLVAPTYLGQRSVPDDDLDYYPLIGAYRLSTEQIPVQFLSATLRDALPIASDWQRHFYARSTEASDGAGAKLVYAFGDDAHPNATSFNNPDYLSDIAAIQANRGNLIQCIIDYGSNQLTIIDGRHGSSTSAAIPANDLPRAFTKCTISYAAASNEITFRVNGSSVTHTLTGSYTDLGYYAVGCAAMEGEMTPLRTSEQSAVTLEGFDENGILIEAVFENDPLFTLVGQQTTDLNAGFSDDDDLLVESLGGGHYRITGPWEGLSTVFYRLRETEHSSN